MGVSKHKRQNLFHYFASVHDRVTESKFTFLPSTTRKQQQKIIKNKNKKGEEERKIYHTSETDSKLLR